MEAPGWGFAAGTFGELVQGEIDETPFLITLPIRWGTRAIFAATGSDSIEVWPSHRKKAAKAAQILLAEWRKPPGGVLIIQSLLPIGKGMASSSADIVATFRAVAACFNRSLSTRQMAQLAARLEPSDGIMYPGVVAFNPLTGQLLERLGNMPSALIVGVLGHGRINTEDHHRHRTPYSSQHQLKLKEALKLARQGIHLHDPDLIGQAGYYSAEVEVERNPDPCLSEILKIAREEATGIIIAHSGTVRGLLVNSRKVVTADIRRLERRLWSLEAGPVYRLVLGPSSPTSLSGRGVGTSVQSPSHVNG